MRCIQLCINFQEHSGQISRNFHLFLCQICIILHVLRLFASFGICLHNSEFSIKRDSMIFINYLCINCGSTGLLRTWKQEAAKTMITDEEGDKRRRL